MATSGCSRLLSNAVLSVLILIWLLEQELESEKAERGHASAHPQEARFWTPDIPQAELDSIATSLRGADEILRHLREFAAGQNGAQLRSKLDAVWREREKFLYHGFEDGEVPGAVQAAMNEVCARNPDIGRPRVDWGDRDVANEGSATVARRSVKGAAEQAEAMQRMSVLNYLE